MPKNLSVRLPDDLRARAQARADRDGQPSLSAVVVGLLTGYADGTLTPPTVETGRPVDPRRAELVRLVVEDGLSLTAACTETGAAYITGRRWLDAAGHADAARGRDAQ